MKTISNNAITCSTDYNYIKYLHTFLETLYNTNTKAEIYVRLVDFTDEQITETRNKHKNVNFIIDNPLMSSKKTLLKVKDKIILKHIYDIKSPKDMKKVLYSPRSFYTCHSRFLSIYELLKKGYNVLSLDVDTLVLKNIDHVFDKKDYDIYSVKSEKNDDIFSNEGFLLFQNSKKIIKYIEKIVDYIFTCNNFTDWDADHYALHEYIPNDVSVFLLDEKYKDRHHRDDAIMWSGDANNKYKEKFSLYMEK